ncbi:hypothetical protein IAU59_004597 [Kwoniella sp. CBS 9459]
MNDEDNDDDLLRRFAALKAPTFDPVPTSPSSSANPSPLDHQSSSAPNVKQSSLSFSKHSDERARLAQEEDDELGRIADGRFDDLNLYKVDPNERATDEDKDEDRLLRERIARLRNDQTDSDSELLGLGGPRNRNDVDDLIAMFTSSSGSAHRDTDDPGPPLSPDTAPSSSHTLSLLAPKQSEASTLAGEANSLLKEAKPFLPDEQGEAKGHAEEGSAVDDNVENDEEEESEEQIIARALDEAKLNHLLDPSGDRDGSGKPDEGDGDVDVVSAPHSRSEDTNNLKDGRAKNATDAAEAAGLNFSFPSLPTHIPVEDASKNDDDEALDDEGQKRLNLLLGLSPSTAKLGDPSRPKATDKKGTTPAPPSAPRFSFPGYDNSRDEDTDSWCCICNADATIICSGCDDDLYCEACWKDGHGTGDGQERGHKARRFVYGRQASDDPRRRLAAA